MSAYLDSSNVINIDIYSAVKMLKKQIVRLCLKSVEAYITDTATRNTYNILIVFKKY